MMVVSEVRTSAENSHRSLHCNKTTLNAVTSEQDSCGGNPKNGKVRLQPCIL